MMERLQNRIRILLQRFCLLISLLRREQAELEKLLAYLRREENRASIRNVKKQALRLLKELMPRKGDGYLKLGFDDPFATGKAMEVAALLYPYYAGKLEVIPIFGEVQLEAKLQVKGRVRIGTLLVIGLRLLLDKNLRRMYRHLRREAKDAVQRLEETKAELHGAAGRKEEGRVR